MLHRTAIVTCLLAVIACLTTARYFVACSTSTPETRAPVDGVFVASDSDSEAPSLKPDPPQRQRETPRTQDHRRAGSLPVEQPVESPSPPVRTALQPDPAPAITHRYESRLENRQPTLVRVTTGPNGTERVNLITPNRHPVWIANADSIAPKSIELVPEADGFDLVFEFENTTNDRKRMGEFVVGGIRFPQQIVYRALFNDGKPLPLDHRGAPYFGGGANYPGALYSPAAVVHSGSDTIGMALHYDVRKYRHGVFIRVESPGGIYDHDGRNWQVRFNLARGDNDPGGRLDPGEQRVYRLSVRTFHGDRSEWVRTLVPYRDFFRQTYGPVRYQRDPRPVRGAELAQVAHTSPQNPRGFLGGENRPDLVGFQPVVDMMRDFERTGFRRIMIWSPSGVNRVNLDGNYPFNFTTGWQSSARLRESVGLLRNYGAGSSDFGLWWGNSSFVMPREWDVPGRAPFDIRNPQHVERAREELNAARATNVTTIGLDAMSSMPAWDAYEWVLQLQSEYPEMRFIFETLSPDFIHTIAPTYLYGTRIPENDPFAANSPMMLADFLNPGHETWAQISGQDVKINSGLPPTAATPANILYERARKAAHDGYVPVVFGPVPTAAGLEAQESWKRTVPPDLRD